MLFFLPALHSEESREVTRESLERSLATRLARHNWGAYSQAMLLFCLLKPIAILPFLLPCPSPSSDRKVPKNFLQTCKILAEDFVTYHLSWFCLSSCMFWWTSYSNFVSFAMKLKSRKLKYLTNIPRGLVHSQLFLFNAIPLFSCAEEPVTLRGKVQNYSIYNIGDELLLNFGAKFQR